MPHNNLEENINQSQNVFILSSYLYCVNEWVGMRIDIR